MKIAIETETRNLTGNDWTPAGPYHTALFHGMQPEAVRGCPMGRSHESIESAIADLLFRTNQESGTDFTQADIEVVFHRGPLPESALAVTDPAFVKACKAASASGYRGRLLVSAVRLSFPGVTSGDITKALKALKAGG